jgi:hypothetical protein
MVDIYEKDEISDSNVLWSITEGAVRKVRLGRPLLALKITASIFAEAH